jgi:hypothetical protein
MNFLLLKFYFMNTGSRQNLQVEEGSPSTCCFLQFSQYIIIHSSILVNTILMYHISLQWLPSVDRKELRRPRLMSSLQEMAPVTPYPNNIA